MANKNKSPWDWRDSDIPVISTKWHIRTNSDGGIAYRFSIDEYLIINLSGYETVALTLCDGQLTIGTIKSRLKHALSLTNDEAGEIITGLCQKNDGKDVLLEPLSQSQGKFTTINTARVLHNLAKAAPSNSQVKRLDTPLSLVLLPTYRCTTDCIYCYAERPNKSKAKELPTKRWIEILEEAGRLGVDMVVFSGGDPLTYTGIMKLLKVTKKYGMCYVLPTKTKITQKKAETLARSLSENGEIQISVDSFDPKIAEFMTQTPNYDQRAKDSIRNLINAGLPVRTNTVVTPFNFECLTDLIKALRNLGITRSHITNYNRTHYRHDDRLLLSAEQIEELNDTVNQLRYELQWDELICSAAPRDFSIPGNNTLEEWENRASCSGGHSAMTILPNGHVTLCEQVPDDVSFVVGDVSGQSLQEVWDSQNLMDFIMPKRNLFKGTACEECHEFDKCHGIYGRCFKDSFFTFGKVYAPSPNCPHSEKGIRLA
ncbi:MAG: radical SAM protein [Arenicellales bacterium]